MAAAISFRCAAGRDLSKRAKGLFSSVRYQDYNSKSFVLPKATKGGKKVSVERDLGEGTGEGLTDRGSSCRACCFVMATSSGY